jgi:hypothetical protein
MKDVESKVGLEAEYLLYNAKGELIIPPRGWDRDGFPLLGEVRGKPGKSVAETVSNFRTRELEILECLRKGHTIQMSDRERCPLKLYKEANAQTDWDEKNQSQGEVKNIYGTDVADYSDQIVKGNKIQGIWVSCGLHVHFSCGVSEEWEYEEPQYELVTLPVGFTVGGEFVKRADMGEDADSARAKALMEPTLYLYAEKGYEKKKEIKLHASRLTKPAIHYIVEEMDKAFFDKFAPAETSRTKYRQKGFFELKPYGFEYRSLPANAKTMAGLVEITSKAFELLNEINSY